MELNGSAILFFFRDERREKLVHRVIPRTFKIRPDRRRKKEGESLFLL
jgi:hypothetical protein